MDLAKTNLQHDDDYFKKYFWSNENKTVLFAYNDATHVWREDGAACSQKNTITTMKHVCGNIIVCACFVYSGTEELINIGSNMKSAKCINNLEDCLRISVKKLEPVPDWMFQKDIDPKHTAKVTRAWFEDNNINVIKWPRQSPYMNRIENVWKLMKSSIREKDRKTSVV